MSYEKLRPYFKWGCYYLLLIVLYTLQTTPGLFVLFGIKPVLIVALATCVCVFEDVLPSAIFAMMTGLLWDVSSNKLLGFNGVILIACGVMISLACVYYFQAKLLNTVAFCTLVLLIQGLLDYVLYYGVWRYSHAYLVLVTNILPTAVYSILPVFPLFFLVRRISDRFRQEARVYKIK